MFTNVCNVCGKTFKSRVEDEWAICRECSNKRIAEMDREIDERGKRNQADVDEQVWRDEWEEA